MFNKIIILGTLTILIVIIVILIFIKYYRNLKKRPSPLLVKNTTKGNKKLFFSNEKIPLSNINGGLEYTFSFWIYIQNWSYHYGLEKNILFWKGDPLNNLKDKSNRLEQQCKELENEFEDDKDKPILTSATNIIKETCKYCQKTDLLEDFYSGSINNKSSNHLSGLSISLDKKTNSLIIRLTLIDGSISILKVDKLAIQKWLNISIILQLRNLDVFINGKLIESLFLPILPSYQSGNLVINPNGGFDGYLSKFQYFNRALKLSEIKKEFKKGYQAIILNTNNNSTNTDEFNISRNLGNNNDNGNGNGNGNDNDNGNGNGNGNDNDNDATKYNKHLSVGGIKMSKNKKESLLSLGQLCHTNKDCKSSLECMQGKCGYQSQSRDFGETCWDNSSCKIGLSCNNFGTTKLNKRQQTDLNRLGIPVDVSNSFNSELANKPFRCINSL